MKSVLKKAVIILCAVTFLLSCVSCSSKQTLVQKDRKIKLAYLPITHALPVMALDKFNKDDKDSSFDIELVKYGAWPELIDALTTGKVDGASVLVELAVKANEQGSKIKTVALGHRDGNVVVVSNNINNVQDLKGKNFAIPSKLSTHYILLYIMLKNAGMSLSDVNIVELPPPEMPAAMFEGRISGYCVAEPFGAKTVVSNKGKVLFKSNELWKDSMCCSLVFRDEFIKNNTDIMQEVINKYVKYGTVLSSDVQKEKEVATEYLKVDKATIDKSIEWINYNNLKIEDREYNTLIEYMTKLNLIKNPPKYNDFVDNSFIDKVE